MTLLLRHVSAGLLRYVVVMYCLILSISFLIISFRAQVPSASATNTYVVMKSLSTSEQSYDSPVPVKYVGNQHLPNQLITCNMTTTKPKKTVCICVVYSWWRLHMVYSWIRHDMETPSVLLALCVWEICRWGEYAGDRCIILTEGSQYETLNFLCC